MISMKLHEILGRILTDVALRQKYRHYGVCLLVEKVSGGDQEAEGNFRRARMACTQTGDTSYPVEHPSLTPAVSWCRASRIDNKGMWHGEYGANRRKLVRDCWRWAKERDL